MLKIKAAARGNAPLQRRPQAAGLIGPRRHTRAGPRYKALYMMVVPSNRDGSRASRAKPGITPTVRYPSEAYSGSALSPVRVSSVSRLRPAPWPRLPPPASVRGQCRGDENRGAPAACGSRRGAADWAAYRSPVAPSRPHAPPAWPRTIPARRFRGGQHLVEPERARRLRAKGQHEADAGAIPNAGVQQFAQAWQQGAGLAGGNAGWREGIGGHGGLRQ